MCIKDRLEKIRGWCKEHKKAIVAAGVGVASAVGAGVLLKKCAESDEAASHIQEQIDSESAPVTYDPGRDCEMVCVVKDTQEELGRIPCTEGYVKDMLDCF